MQVTPDDNIKVTDLKKGNNKKRYKHFLNTGQGGITFKINVLIRKDEIWENSLFDNTLQKYVLNYPRVTSILKV